MGWHARLRRPNKGQTAGDLMIEITFRSKDNGSILRTETFKTKKYESVLKKCKGFDPVEVELIGDCE